jgi:hypothetical protein
MGSPVRVFGAVAASQRGGVSPRPAALSCRRRGEKIWWNELWMGEMGPHYAASCAPPHLPARPCSAPAELPPPATCHAAGWSPPSIAAATRRPCRSTPSCALPSGWSPFMQGPRRLASCSTCRLPASARTARPRAWPEAMVTACGGVAGIASFNARRPPAFRSSSGPQSSR